MHLSNRDLLWFLAIVAVVLVVLIVLGVGLMRWLVRVLVSPDRPVPRWVWALLAGAALATMAFLSLRQSTQ